MAVGAVALAGVQARERSQVVPRPPLPGRFYLPELDLLRLVAFLMVWSSHACFALQGLAPRGWLVAVNGTGSLGVPIFFFLSAYLITELLRREQQAAGTVHLRMFYVRRILRIWPLYFGILIAYAALGLVVHGFRVEPGRLAASALLSGNWYLARHAGLTSPLRHLWSLSVEEQWYLAWPLLARALATRRLLGTCAVCFLAAYGVLALLAGSCDRGTLAYAAWLNSGVQFQYFALGAAAALLLRGSVPRLHLPVRVSLAAIGMAALCFAGSACSIKQAEGTYPALLLGSGYLLAALGTAALFFAVLGVGAQGCPRALVRLGQLSFGLYVFHETAFFCVDEAARTLRLPHTLPTALLSRLASLVLTAGLAWASYRYWERPFLRLKERWTLVRSREAV